MKVFYDIDIEGLINEHVEVHVMCVLDKEYVLVV